ncbi:hypothetical protein GF585_13905 [Staphylococcus aureus]|nr:hypothetical protein [Staphylococcus aureus]MRV64810.1 hypothetical protein [Staphylococcus aureus]
MFIRDGYNIWHKDIGLEESRIIRIEGNFWDIGEGLQDRTMKISMVWLFKTSSSPREQGGTSIAASA